MDELIEVPTPKYSTAGLACKDCESGVQLDKLRIYCMDLNQTIMPAAENPRPGFCPANRQYKIANVDKWKGEYLDVR